MSTYARLSIYKTLSINSNSLRVFHRTIANIEVITVLDIIAIPQNVVTICSPFCIMNVAKISRMPKFINAQMLHQSRVICVGLVF
ncbi:uncharacterized protein N7529_011720 [Penicillium soppii]|uniref:uncharacterized protein n=1 Tax=Penicillium soppii TaxID=69789 RepID=UPI002547AFD1|nr:uncharacterized protein N7529_011720 [Penicillium soppii]KAJ5852335.1 hypothetical protein N7529_011720 [Penicillium soppii]